MRLRALVLAAGLGRRLRPLTETLPKPLLPVAGRPILSWTLERLAALGCEAVAINLHHRGADIRRYFGDRFRGVPLRYSEEPELLGTLGALGPLRQFFAPADLILVINGDSLCRWPLKKLVRRHQAVNAQGSLLLARRPDPRRFGGGVGVDGEGRVLSLFEGDEVRGEVERRCVFAGAHVLSPSLLHRVGEGPADFISDLYLPLLGEGARLQGVVTGSRWHDLGTPHRYLEGVLDWGRGRWPRRVWRRSWVASDASVEGRCRLSACVVEAGARVESRSRLERVLVLPGGRVRRGSRLRDCIVGFDAVLPAGSRISGRVVVVQGRDLRPRRGDSVVGGMIFHPLEDGAGSDRRRRTGGRPGGDSAPTVRRSGSRHRTRRPR